MILKCGHETGRLSQRVSRAGDYLSRRWGDQAGVSCMLVKKQRVRFLNKALWSRHKEAELKNLNIAVIPYSYRGRWGNNLPEDLTDAPELCAREDGEKWTLLFCGLPRTLKLHQTIYFVVNLTLV